MVLYHFHNIRKVNIGEIYVQYVPKYEQHKYWSTFIYKLNIEATLPPSTNIKSFIEYHYCEWPTNDRIKNLSTPLKDTDNIGGKITKSTISRHFYLTYILSIL